MKSERPIAVFLHALLGGGAERNLIELGCWLSERDHPVDLVLAERRGPLQGLVPESLRVVDLGVRSRLLTSAAVLRLPLASQPDVLRMVRREGLTRSLLPLAAYLRRERPRAIVTSIAKNELLALHARHLAGVDTRVVLREPNIFSMQQDEAAGRRNRLLTRLARRWFPQADAVVAVSGRVAEDLAATVGVAAERIFTIESPVDAERVARLSREPLDDSWLQPGEPPLLLAAARLTEQKGFETLLRAFAELSRERPLRLMILGEGEQRATLEALRRDLGIEADVSLPGFVENPYRYMGRAAAFVLSSAWEGFPNVLLEALACGCPVASTDCPSGPAEILDCGRFGALAPPGDVIGLAKAIAATLDDPLEAEMLRARALDFAPDAAFRRYLAVLDGDSSAATA